MYVYGNVVLFIYFNPDYLSLGFFFFRHAIHKRRKPKYGPETLMSSNNLNAMSSAHDFHRFAIHHNGVSPVLHFHLAGSINPETGQ